MNSPRKEIRLHEIPGQKILLGALRMVDCGVFLNSNNLPGQYDWLYALDALETLENKEIKGAFKKVQRTVKNTNDWWFGFLGYDLKNDTEHLPPPRRATIEFPPLWFFRPRWVVVSRGGKIALYTHDPDESEFFHFLNKVPERNNYPQKMNKPMRPVIKKEAYLDRVNNLLRHIYRGDIYEVNFCREYHGSAKSLNPVAVYEKLNHLTEAPFSTLLKTGKRWAVSGSPERFLMKRSNTLTSQPIKGTARRESSPAADEQAGRGLQNDLKERVENLMIVDLVRNDLARSCVYGTVHVPELCGLHSFKTVHQLVSTVSGKLQPEITSIDAIKNAFPMGSMTGVPKLRAMELIDEHEETPRGLYSGAIGYLSPDGDFDFNVVIRTILMDEASGKVSFTVGGAITSRSTAENELAECGVKAAAMKKALCVQKDQ